ncbi:MAG: CDP-alcohol phosphatidyltransferase family protein [Planctomycetota bacterium]
MIKQIPNILTVGRFVLTVIFLVMVLYAPRLYADGERPFPDFLDYAFIIFVIAGITDLVDGTIARSLGVTSKFGRIVDPLADKVLVCGTFICFAIIGEPKLFDLSPVMLGSCFGNNSMGYGGCCYSQGGVCYSFTAYCRGQGDQLWCCFFR